MLARRIVQVNGELSRHFGATVEQAALGMIRLANANMVNALKLVSVHRGYDPRDFTLVAFGGAGPLHAADIALNMGIRNVLVPPRPGILSALGLLVLFGVVKKNAILQVDHMNNLRRQGMEELTAVIQANRDRLRPILMTTMAAMLAGVPLALGTGIGAELRRPLGIVMIGGLIVSQLLTLFTTPVIYLAFDRLASRLSRRRGINRRDGCIGLKECSRLFGKNHCLCLLCK